MYHHLYHYRVQQSLVANNENQSAAELKGPQIKVTIRSHFAVSNFFLRTIYQHNLIMNVYSLTVSLIHMKALFET